MAAMRRSLGAASEPLGNNPVVKREGEIVFFWEETITSTPRR